MTEALRKPDALRRNLLMLRCVGLWPEGKKYFTNTNYTYYSIWMVIFFLILDYLAVSSTMFYCYGDWEMLSNRVSYFAQRSITLVQVIFFLRKLVVTKTIMEQLDQDIIQPKTFAECEIVRRSLTSYFFITTSYFLFCSITCVIYLLLPFLMGERRYPFEVWYPLQDLASPLYEIVYVHQCVAVWLNHLIHTGVDMLCAGLMATIGSQCDLLRARLVNFQPRETKFGRYDLYFRDIFAHHREILLLSKRVNVLFSHLVFGEISLVIILLCTALFRLSAVVDKAPFEFLLLGAFAFAMTLQLFLYCWFGSEVFSKIMKSSWSFYVLLQQMNANEANSP
ncbi:odorant receptor 46a-like [Coccinella septempunctata]|uniref:odorant receptor 46a-like n=1 Tax=Coccinella septempunctata TaxID=41139 RepID=UPI001D09334B|nr:odorant receptor 46a-like [Coccinella septempunctata]